MTFHFIALPQTLYIYRYPPNAELTSEILKASEILKDSFFSISRTPHELSIICEKPSLPLAEECSPDWRALYIKGRLDHSMIGVMASITDVLAKAECSVFALSTFDTDYILVKTRDFDKAIQALSLTNTVTETT